MMREKLLLFCALLANLALVIGLRLENVSIPLYGMKDGSVKLGCDFDLERDTLLVLKWYKEGHEFFRYSIQNTPPILTFPADGVHVDITQSNMNQVVLKNISLRTTGTYKCEVSADKSFRTLSQQGDLLVVAPPKTLPHMDCFPKSANIGDSINCNCTSYSSKPAASLMYFLNGDTKANFGDMVEYIPVSESYQLETSVLGLSFQIDSRHFENGILEIKCTATIGNGYWVTNITITEASINVDAQPSIPGHNRLLSGGSSQSEGLLRLLFPLSLLACEVLRRNLVLFL